MTTEMREHRDVKQVYHLRAPIHYQSPRGRSVEEDDRAVGLPKVKLVVPHLRVELRLHKQCFLLFGEWQEVQVRLTRRREERKEEISIRGHAGTESKVQIHPREAYGVTLHRVSGHDLQLLGEIIMRDHQLRDRLAGLTDRAEFVKAVTDVAQETRFSVEAADIEEAMLEATRSWREPWV